MNPPLVIGWRERLDFPDWGVRRTRVKIDTGARTSAINAVIREMRQRPDGTPTVVFEIGLFRNKVAKTRVVEAPLIKTIRVRCTSGETVERLVIETSICLGTVTKKIHLSIADRNRMLVPIILGRTALADDFLVDVSRKYVLSE